MAEGNEVLMNYNPGLFSDVKHRNSSLSSLQADMFLCQC